MEKSKNIGKQNKSETNHQRNTHLYDLLGRNRQLLQDKSKTGHLMEDSALHLKYLENLLETSGFLPDEPAWNLLYKELRDREGITFQDFSRLMEIDPGFLEKIITRDLVIPDFQSFSNITKKVFEDSKEETGGAVASYIPQLAKANPHEFGVSICTIDGQQLHLGDYQVPFSVQSVTKVINYGLALEEHGEQKTHRYVGKEPSGRGFNEFVLNNDGVPHNPMSNTGAIMVSSLLKKNLDIASRVEFILGEWQRFAGNHRQGFSTSVYLSERETGDGNYAIAYMLKQKKLFPPDTDLMDTLRLYFQCCSIESTAESLAIIGATLANGGKCPMTKETVIQLSTAINCLSIMYACGMYDFSGEFAFDIGIPAKSGVSGCILAVIPGICGIGIYSPPLDKMGNSKRGVKFCKLFSEAFNFHVFSSMKNV